MWNFSDCSVALRFVFLTHQQWLNCVDVFISMCTAPTAVRTPVNCSELYQQPVDAVLRPTFVQKLCYKLLSIVSFTFIQIFDQNCLLYWTASKIAHLLDTMSKFRLFSVSGLKEWQICVKKVPVHSIVPITVFLHYSIINAILHAFTCLSKLWSKGAFFTPFPTVIGQHYNCTAASLSVDFTSINGKCNRFCC